MSVEVDFSKARGALVTLDRGLYKRIKKVGRRDKMEWKITYI